MTRREIAVVGSGFAGSLAARVLAVLGHDVVLLERGTHPRFAIGESTTPLANLSLERLARRYGLADCWHLATHGRWLAHHAGVRRGLKRGFTFYRHHPGRPFENAGLDSERLLVAASPSDDIADTHWLRADVDHHFVREAVAAGVDYRDRVELTGAERAPGGWRLTGTRGGEPLGLRAEFVVDASGPGGFLARQLAIPSALDRVETQSALVYSHFDGVRTMPDVVPGLPDGPYPDDRAAVHHVIDEGWMYALRFDDDVTSAGFLLTPRGLASLGADAPDPAALWRAVVERYPTIGAAYDDATPRTPIGFVPRVQHRLARAAGDGWLLLPHAYAFVDPLFSTGIAWGLRAVERLALAFEHGVPNAAWLARYDAALAAEATQIDRLVAGAYEAMAHFELLAAHAMLYFATVSFAEVGQRLAPEDDATWSGFLGVGDAVTEPLPGEALRRLRTLSPADADARRAFAAWVADAIHPRNVAGLADPSRHNLYPVDLDTLIDRHALLGMTRAAVLAALPALRGMGPEPDLSQIAGIGSRR
ncbi:tryptophan halogenase [Gemmatirosa kalamazoonensis]|uniref:Tryptophan halogenase n=1 Tax=Gemmatirosa kalamazoonensis TaxID=861299 RepID=W0RM71_9BACT|nr:FAD-dependent oxidoreductase [Gemmatirosa kalamazoonensis]AHG91562.1 tryptophan halogenase [Gemmatirosa kalamazoonensis]